MSRRNLLADGLQEHNNSTPDTPEYQPMGDMDFEYQKIYSLIPENMRVVPLRLEYLDDFFTADIGFKPHSDEEMLDLAANIKERGQLDPIIVRKRPKIHRFEILAGMRRKQAFLQNNEEIIFGRIIDVDDDQAVLIATDSNLKRRQFLYPSEKAFAYKAQVDALKHQGKAIHIPGDDEPVDDGRRQTARDRVAKLNGIKVSEIRSHLKLTKLIPSLLDLVDSGKIDLTPAGQLSRYNLEAQEVIYAYCFEGAQTISLNGFSVKYLIERCPPSDAVADLLPAVLDSLVNALAEPPEIFKLPVERAKLLPLFDLGMDEDAILQEFYQWLQEKQNLAIS